MAGFPRLLDRPRLYMGTLNVQCLSYLFIDAQNLFPRLPWASIDLKFCHVQQQHVGC